MYALPRPYLFRRFYFLFFLLPRNTSRSAAVILSLGTAIRAKFFCFGLYLLNGIILSSYCNLVAYVCFARLPSRQHKLGNTHLFCPSYRGLQLTSFYRALFSFTVTIFHPTSSWTFFCFCRWSTDLTSVCSFTLWHNYFLLFLFFSFFHFS